MKIISDKIFIIVKILLLIILTIMTLAAFLQVIFRYVLQVPLPWTEELAKYLFVWLTFIGSAAAIKKKGHIAMDILVNIFPDSIQKLARILSLLSFLFFSYLMIEQGIFMVIMNKGQMTDALGITMAYPYMAIPVGGLLMAFFIIDQIFETIRGEA